MFMLCSTYLIPDVRRYKTVVIRLKLNLYKYIKTYKKVHVDCYQLSRSLLFLIPDCIDGFYIYGFRRYDLFLSLCCLLILFFQNQKETEYIRKFLAKTFIYWSVYHSNPLRINMRPPKTDHKVVNDHCEAFAYNLSLIMSHPIPGSIQNVTLYQFISSLLVYNFLLIIPYLCKCDIN